jgi:hypothetical protein
MRVDFATVPSVHCAHLTLAVDVELASHDSLSVPAAAECFALRVG